MAPKKDAAIDFLIASGLALTLLIAIAGGFTIHLKFLSIPVHQWWRPTAFALVLAVVRWWGRREGGRGHTTTDDDAWQIASICFVALVIAAVGYWMIYLTAICGGSDSYGYVSASRLIARGRLVEPQEIATWLPVINPLDAATPAGYVPAADRSGIGPAYPLGLPVLMATAAWLAGPDGPYVVAPVAALLLVIITWQLGRIWYGRQAAWLAAVLVAWSPIVAAYAKQPMSDVPAAMLCMLSLLCLSVGPRWPFIAGVAAGASFLVRPGGIGAIAALAAIPLWPRETRRRHVARFILGLAPFVSAQAVLQWRLFGSVLTTGYGPLATVYQGSSVARNVAVYTAAMWDTNSIVWFAGFVAALLLARQAVRTPFWVSAGNALPYLLYAEFPHWEVLRFLMPAVVLLSIVSAAGLAAACARLERSSVQAVAAVLCAALYVQSSVRFMAREGVPDLMIAEQRYPLVAEHLKTLTPPGSVVFAAQHSGSIRHYGDRLTLRWDLLRPEDLRPALVALASRGHRTYVVLEGTEQHRFDLMFAEPLHSTRMYPFGRIRDVQVWELVP